MHRRIAALTLLLLAALLLAGCSSPAPAQPDSLVIAQGVDATTLDPHMHAETTTGNVCNQIFDRLLTRNQDMELQPDLALSVTPVSDLVWEVILRPGVTFHNGEVFDAESVKFSIERILDPANHSPQIANLSVIERVDIVDPYTVRITTKQPYPILPGRLVLPMVPPQYIAENGNEHFAQNPVGTGPYRFVSWTRDEAVVLAANPEYWQGERLIPENATRLAELQSGAVDLIVNVPPHQAATLDAGANTRAARTPSGRIIIVQLVTDRGPLADPRVRRALNHAVDVPGIIGSILEGNGRRLTQPLTSLDFGFDPALPGYTYDPAKAKALLAEAGYPDGLEITFDSPAGRYAMDKEVAEAVVGQLEAAGIRAKLQINEWGIHVQKILEKKMTGAFLIGWGTTLFDGDATLYPLFRTGQRNSFYSDPAVDALLDEARSILDADRREMLYQTAAAKLTADGAILFLYQPEDIYGVNADLKWQPRPDEQIFVAEMEFGE